MDIILFRVVDAAIVIVAGPIMRLFMHHQPMPQWFNHGAAWFQTLMALWGDFSHCGGHLPHSPFDQICSAYLDLWLK